MKTWKTWTAKEIRRLEELRLDGLSSPAIARILGRTVASVKCRLQSHGFRKSSGLMRWLPILMRPHTVQGAAIAAGTTKWAVKQAKRKLRRLDYEVPNATKTSVTPK